MNPGLDGLNFLEGFFFFSSVKGHNPPCPSPRVVVQSLMFVLKFKNCSYFEVDRLLLPRTKGRPEPALG